MYTFTYRNGAINENINYEEEEFLYGFICGIYNIDRDNFIIETEEERITYNNYYKFMRDYILATVYDITKLPNPNKRYGWEVNNVIYQFNKYEYIEGFIYASEYMERDFREYVSSLPYDKDTFYNIKGYDIFFESDERNENVIPIMTRDRQDIIDIDDFE